MLKVENLYVNYGNIEVLKGISFHVEEGEMVCLLGTNGMGKSTTLSAISGLVTPKAGSIFFYGSDITGLSTEKIIKLGISHIPEGRLIFPDLTVMEHLELGAYQYYSDRSRKDDFKQALALVFNTFPTLKDKQKRIARTLSGGEQQMLVIGRGLMSKPKLLIMDEITMGLAPILSREILTTVRSLTEQGLSALLVEQNAHAALQVATRGYVFVDGKIALEGTSKELLSNQDMRAVYLGGRVSTTPETPK